MTPPAGMLARMADTLSAFEPDGGPLSFTEVMDRTGLPRATTHRLLAELERLRFVQRGADGCYRLGGRLFELGMLAAVGRSLIEVATPFLQDLYARTRLTIHLGVRESSEVVYVAKIGGHRQTRMPSQLGGRMPLHCTALGKVLLAFGEPADTDRLLRGPLTRRTARTIIAPGLLRAQLDAVLLDGVAYEYEESAPGVSCVAAPILDASDRPIAAVSIAGPATTHQPTAHAALVRAAAAGIAGTLAQRAG